jgi:threonine/homoserine/homoserine lactone efflux protein
LMGFITSTSNPYFFLWWATVGSMLILTSLDYGIFGFILFALVHWSCDLGWYSFVTLSVHRSRHLWTEMVQNAVFTCCGLILIIFGVYFLLSLVY